MLQLVRTSHQYPVAAALFLLMIASPLSWAAESAKKAPPLPETWQLYQDRYPPISLFNLKMAMDDDTVVLIDANNAETYKKNHIPGALSLPALIAQGDKSKLPQSKNAMIVVYCGGPQCSAWFKAADYASKQGYRTIRHFRGGLKEWRENKQLFENDL